MCRAISIAMPPAPETEIKSWICPQSHVILLLKNHTGKNKICIRTLCQFKVNGPLFLGGSQRQQAANMFNVGAEGNVQLQHVSILDMHICSSCQRTKTMTRKRDKTQYSYNRNVIGRGQWWIFKKNVHVLKKIK